ncbi:hypothetical protein CFP56_008037 [Quercus suber]|uniref:Transposase MuDR plant domain-containing protein n=1 Tax=Quercus suber TaxID=58331 RepID=A0AAW0L608_QUESU
MFSAALLCSVNLGFTWQLYSAALGDGFNQYSFGVSVEDVDVYVDDFDDDNDVDLEDVDEAFANNEFEEGGNLVDEGNDARCPDGNGDVGNMTYDWYNTDYDDLARHGKWTSCILLTILMVSKSKKLPKFKHEYLKDLEFVLGVYFRDNKQFKEFLKHGYGILLSKNEKSRMRYKCVEGCPQKVSKGINKEANFWISAYMILTHVVGLSMASRFLQIGWQKSVFTNFKLILIT